MKVKVKDKSVISIKLNLKEAIQLQMFLGDIRGLPVVAADLWDCLEPELAYHIDNLGIQASYPRIRSDCPDISDAYSTWINNINNIDI